MASTPVILEDPRDGNARTLFVYDAPGGSILNGAGDAQTFVNAGEGRYWSATVTEAITGLCYWESIDNVTDRVKANGWKIFADTTDPVYLLQDDVLDAIEDIDVGEGSGARTFTIHVDDGDGTDLEGAVIRMIKGASNFPVTTNSNGLKQVSRDDGTWQVGITLDGYTFDPVPLAVDADIEGDTIDYSMTPRTYSGSDPPMVSVVITCRDDAGQRAAGIKCTCKMTSPQSGDGQSLGSGLREALSADGTGALTIGDVKFDGIFPSGTYKFRRSTGRETGKEYEVTIPADATGVINITNMLGP